MSGTRWQEITSEISEMTERLKVPGGWLYRTVMWPSGGGEGFAIAMVFVPEAPEVWEE